MIQRQPESPFTASSYVPKLARSLFPDATPEQYKFLDTLVNCITSLESRLQAVEGDRRASETVPRRARKGPDGIFSGALVHVDSAGVAWLAVNTNADRPFTHVADTIKGDQVTVIGAGRVKVRCLPDAGAGDKMWVSSQPGFATNAEPTGAALIQTVGARIEQTSASTGLALVSVAGGQVSAGISSIDATRIADGSVDNTEFEALDGIAGNIQVQLDDKVPWPAVGAAGGVAGLDGAGTVPMAQIPAGIDAAKIGGGVVSNAEFAFLDGVTSGIQGQINGKQAADSDLTALAALATTGLIARTATGSAATRTITAGSDISVSNGNGVSGNPTIAAGTNIPRLNAANAFTAKQTVSGAAGELINVSWSAYVFDAAPMVHYYDGGYHFWFGSGSGATRSGSGFAWYGQSGVLYMDASTTTNYRIAGTTRLQLSGAGAYVTGDVSASGQGTFDGGVNTGNLFVTDGTGTTNIYYDAFADGGTINFHDDVNDRPYLRTSGGFIGAAIVGNGIYGTAAGANYPDQYTSYMVLNPSLGSTTVYLPQAAPVGTIIWAAVINRDGTNTNTLTFDAGTGGHIHGLGVYAQNKTLTGVQSNQFHRWFRMVKSSSVDWLVDTGLSDI